jgi:hypothetical protein
MNQETHLRDLSEIRSMMERSSRFLSLSGLSGIFIGIFALIGAFVAYRFLEKQPEYVSTPYSQRGTAFYTFFVIDFAAVLLASLTVAVVLSARRARKKGLSVWDGTSRRMLVNLFIPLGAGGLFCGILVLHAPQLIAATTLIFYGLALLNASKYTLPDIRTVGLIEIVLGLLCGYLAGTGTNLLFWALGFGVLHIVYGAVLYNKYERL